MCLRIILCLQRRTNLPLINAPFLCNVKMTNARFKHKVCYKPYVPPCVGDHDHKNMAMKRPMSPHLTICETALPAVTSILQRGTGVILSFYALMLSSGTLLLPNGVNTYVSMIQSLNLSVVSVFIAKILLGLPFAFHYFNAMRYCAWNLGKFLSMKDVYGTAKKSFILTAALTILFALL